LNDLRFLEVTHANRGGKVIVDLALLFTWEYWESHKSVVLQSSGGALMPVKEDLDFITKAKSAYQKGESNNGA
jgi:hypothetical protein